MGVVSRANVSWLRCAGAAEARGVRGGVPATGVGEKLAMSVGASGVSGRGCSAGIVLSVSGWDSWCRGGGRGHGRGVLLPRTGVSSEKRGDG